MIALFFAMNPRALVTVEISKSVLRQSEIEEP